MKVHCIAGVGYDSNVYLLEDKDPMVVDTGTGIYAESTLEEMSKIVPLDRISRIVLTHSHYDHIGGASAFAKAIRGRIYLHELEAERILAGDFALTISDAFGSRLSEIPVEPLKTGKRLELGDSTLEVMHSPGHSPGSIVLYEAASASAIVGDTVFCDGGVGRWDLPGGDLGQLTSSVKQLKGLGLKNLYPGHGTYAEGDAQYHMGLAAEYIAEGY